MLIRGDARHLPLADQSVQCVVTSPPYFGLRDYGHPQQLGLETTPDAYVAALVAVFQEVRRVLKDDGTLWLNIGDSYAGSWGARGRGEGTNAPRPDLEAKYGTSAPARHVFRPGNLLKNTGVSSRDGLGAVDGCKAKDLIGIPWRVALALQADGWYLRSDIIWSKPNPMPESVTDRPTKAHEYLFLLAKSERYYYDAAAIAEASADLSRVGDDVGRWGNALKPSRAAAMGRAESGNEASGAHWVMGETRNKRSVWTVPTMPYAGAHFATMPEALVEPCILAGCPLGGLVLDPFIGSGTVGAVAERLGRRWVGTDLSYQELAQDRTAQMGLRWEATV